MAENTKKAAVEETATDNIAEDKYTNWVHKFGRLGLILALFVMFAMPTIVCAVYDIFPPLTAVIKGSISLGLLFIPLGLSEVISYTPMLGSACYLTFLTGNVMNLKLPNVLNAQKMAKVEQSTFEGDAVATLATAVSSIVTVLIIALGVLLLVPLQPLLQTPAVKTATAYLLPALFGGAFLGFLGRGDGEYVVKNKLLAIIVPVILVVVLNRMKILTTGLEGVAILCMLPITIGISRLLWKKGIIKVEKNVKSGVVPSEEIAEEFDQ